MDKIWTDEYLLRFHATYNKISESNGQDELHCANYMIYYRFDSLVKILPNENDNEDSDKHDQNLND